MTFTTTKYESDKALVHPIRIKTSRLAASGTPPEGAQTSDIIVKISKGNNEFGIRPRGVRCFRLIGTAPNQFKKYTFVPVLTLDSFASATYSVGAQLTIDGVEWTVGGKRPEDY